MNLQRRLAGCFSCAWVSVVPLLLVPRRISFPPFPSSFFFFFTHCPKSTASPGEGEKKKITKGANLISPFPNSI